MVATGFTTSTGLTSDPTAQFIPPQTIPDSGPIRVDPPEEAVVTSVAPENVWEPSDQDREQFANLLTVGVRSKTIDCFGHPVKIQSLTVEDDQNVGLYTAKFLGTEAYPSAVRLATVAAAVRTIDGREVYRPLSDDESSESVFQAKIEKMQKYHASVVWEIYEPILLLDKEFAELAVKLGKLKG